MSLPKLLILDDLFGRDLWDGRNADRENLCAHFLWRDVTGDKAEKASRQRVLRATAEAVFSRAQSPPAAGVGDVVENDFATAMAVVQEGWTKALARGDRPWAMVFLDLCFYTGAVTEQSHRRSPGMPEGRTGDDDPGRYFGLVLLDAIHREFPDLPVMILSSKPREDVSLEFSRRGAVGFIARDDPRGPELLEEALRQHGLLPDTGGEVIGNSLPVLLALREARRAARHGQNTLIRGERGTGKELLARYLHRAVSDAARRPFISVNSAIFTASMFASELFGIEAKTATNVEARTGLIETADGGDLFLDEIADMPPEVQASLLRVLQERQITRVGGRKSIPVDVRFISATNIEIELEDQGFRADLLDRLCLGGSLWLPPLRERKSDIPLLVDKFVRDAEAAHRGALPRQVTTEALDRLSDYDWPGSIRELRSAIYDAVGRHPDVEYLVPDHLRLGAGGAGAKQRPRPMRKLVSPAPESRDKVRLSELVAEMEGCIFPSEAVGEWAGQLGRVQRVQALLLARYLQAALDATKRRTPDAPLGKIQIHPAVKLMTGDPMLSASSAADIIKRLLTPLAEELDADLAEAYRTAIKLRPKSGRSMEADVR